MDAINNPQNGSYIMEKTGAWYCYSYADQSTMLAVSFTEPGGMWTATLMCAGPARGIMALGFGGTAEQAVIDVTDHALATWSPDRVHRDGIEVMRRMSSEWLGLLGGNPPREEEGKVVRVTVETAEIETR